MPKHEAMAQLSRPFQVVLVVFVLFACVWFFALQGHSTGTSGSGSSATVTTSAPATSAPSSSASASAATGNAGSATSSSTHVYHGSAPGVEGLSRAISKAHEAVANSQQSAKQVEHESAENNAPTASTTASAQATKTPASTTKVLPHTTTAATQPATKPSSTVHKSTNAPSQASGATAALKGQRAVEVDLAKGDVVVLLFWNPKGADDVVVHRAVQAVQKADRRPHQRLAVQEAPASKVASYGSVTRGVQVYGTPTIFIINRHGGTIVLTGVQDAFAIEQAIVEARQS
jgi:hypothetical protein